MKEKTLLLIALMVIAVGLPLLLVLSLFAHPQEKFVTVYGYVEKSYTTNGVTIVYVQPSSEIPVVFFDKEPQFSKGEFVRLNGTLQEYQGRVEVVVE